MQELPIATWGNIMQDLPVMHELPRRVDGLQPTLAALNRVQSSAYHGNHEYVLPQMVPARLAPDLTTASTLCRIKKGISSLMKKLSGNGKKNKN